MATTVAAGGLSIPNGVLTLKGVKMVDESRTEGGLRLLTKHEIAQKLQVSERTIDQWRQCNRFPDVKLGRVVRFNEAAVAEWLVSQAATQARKGAHNG